jgi:hypothetical protein
MGALWSSRNPALQFFLPLSKECIVFRTYRTYCTKHISYILYKAHIVHTVQSIYRTYCTKCACTRLKRIAYYNAQSIHTEWQRPLSGIHSIMMEKLAQAGGSGGCTSTPFHYSYHHVQSCSVRSS